MDLSILSNDELRDEFLKVNHDYVRAMTNTPVELRKGKYFVLIKLELNAVLEELKRRREQGWTSLAPLLGQNCVHSR